MQGICNFQEPIQNLDELHLAGHGNKTKQLCQLFAKHY